MKTLEARRCCTVLAIRDGHCTRCGRPQPGGSADLSGVLNITLIGGVKHIRIGGIE